MIKSTMNSINVLDEEESEKRTIRQNSALHLWCEQIAEAYNEKGLTVDAVISNFKMELYWGKETVKELIIRTAIKRMYGKDSTTKLLKGRQEIDKLVDVITKFNAQMDIGYIPFPHSLLKELEE